MNDEATTETRDADPSAEESAERATRDLDPSEKKDPDELFSHDAGAGSEESSVAKMAEEEVTEASESEPEPAPAPPAASQEAEPVATDGALLPQEQNDRLRGRWEEIQASFVDRPQDAVQEADALVVDLMQRVTGGLTSERERLESQWAEGDDVSTEDLRVALTRYRTFFDRLLAT